jgi:hypothetical protein
MRFEKESRRSGPAALTAVKCDGEFLAALERFEPDAIHVATEGPIGLATQRYCLRRGEYQQELNMLEARKTKLEASIDQRKAAVDRSCAKPPASAEK